MDNQDQSARRHETVLVGNQELTLIQAKAILQGMVDSTLQDESLAEMGEQMVTYEVRKLALERLAKEVLESPMYVWVSKDIQETYIADLLNALKGFIDVVEEPPAPNCSCHIAAPCGDCVDNGALREVFENARRVMEGKS